MPELKVVAKSSGAESAATASRHGTDDSTGSLSTWSRAHMAVLTHLRTASGVVGGRAAATPAEITQDRSSLLSAAEWNRLTRISQDRRNGFMVSAPDVEFLLDVIERLSR